MASNLMEVYMEKKEDIERTLKEIRTSDRCLTDANFASDRRLPMITTLMYYLQCQSNRKKGISIEAIELFIYGMIIADDGRWKDVAQSMVWCPIEQTLREGIMQGIINIIDGRYFVNAEKISRKNGIPLYWDILNTPCKKAKQVCNSMITSPNRVSDIYSSYNNGLDKLWNYIKKRCKGAPRLEGVIVDTFDIKTYNKANYGCDECRYLIKGAERLKLYFTTEDERKIKGIVWVERIPYILFGKISDSKLEYEFYNIDIESEPYTLTVEADRIENMWNCWENNLGKIIQTHFENCAVEDIHLFESNCH